MSSGYHLHANGIRHHLIHHAGRGPALLVVPGITSAAITWSFVAERLSDHFDVHVLDVRGRGLSQAGDLDYSLDAMARDIVAVASTISEQPVTVLGHSMGARSAIRAARTSPSALSRLILVDPPVSGPGRRAYPVPWSWFEESIRLAQRGCGIEGMRTFCPTMTDEQLLLRAEWLHTCHLKAIRTAYDGFHGDDIHADLPHIDVPIRLVVAGGAPVVQDEDVADMRSLAPGMEVITVEGAGHMIPWDDLDGFIEAVTG